MAHQHEIWTDTTKNRLYTRARGFFTPNEVEKNIETLLGELGKVKPGFDVISDVAELGVGTPEGVKELHLLFDMYKKRKIGRMIFVMGESLSRMQIARVAKETDLKIEIANSIEEAEQMLDKPQ